MYVCSLSINYTLRTGWLLGTAGSTSAAGFPGTELGFWLSPDSIKLATKVVSPMYI